MPLRYPLMASSIHRLRCGWWTKILFCRRHTAQSSARISPSLRIAAAGPKDDQAWYPYRHRSDILLRAGGFLHASPQCRKFRL